MKRYLSFIMIGTFIMGLADISFAKKYRHYHLQDRYHKRHHDGIVGKTVRSTERLGSDTVRSTGRFLESL